jgi:hypothetical protein
MKSFKIVFIALFCFQLSSCQSSKPMTSTAASSTKSSSNAEGKLQNGVYFIQNLSENLVIEPYQRQYSSLTDLNMVPLDRSGIQKWVVTEYLDPKTKKPTGIYSISLFVDAHYAITNKWSNPRLGKSKEYPKDRFSIVYLEKEKAYVIKSTTAKGDCLGKSQGRFAKYVPNDSSSAIMWRFIKSDS